VEYPLGQEPTFSTAKRALVPGAQNAPEVEYPLGQEPVLATAVGAVARLLDDELLDDDCRQ